MSDLTENQINSIDKAFHAASEFDQKDEEGTLEATDRENLKDAFAEMIESLEEHIIEDYRCIIDNFNAAIDDPKTKSDRSCESTWKSAANIVKSKSGQYAFQKGIEAAKDHMKQKVGEELWKRVENKESTDEKNKTKTPQK